MKMDACSALTILSVSKRPFACGFHILFWRFVSILIFQIEINDDEIKRWFDVVELMSIQIRELSFDIVPFFHGLPINCGVLRRTISQHFIKKRFGTIHYQSTWMILYRGSRRLCKLLFDELRVIASHLLSVDPSHV